MIEVPTDTLNIYAIATNGSFLKRTRLQQRLMSKFITQAGLNLFLFKTFDEKIQQLVVGGLIDYYDRDYSDFLNPRRYEHLYPKGPKVLTMEHLKAGFIVCCVSLSIAMVAFVLEWIARLIEFIVLKNIMLAFYQIKMSDYRNNLFSKIEEASIDEECLELNDNEEFEQINLDDELDLICLKSKNSDDELNLECLSIFSEESV